jgi:hypothetical protein
MDFLIVVSVMGGVAVVPAASGRSVAENLVRVFPGTVTLLVESSYPLFLISTLNVPGAALRYENTLVLIAVPSSNTVAPGG